VTIEVVKVAQAKLMGSDISMYHSDSDTPMVARTSNLNEELGQIEYIFSDKTGTLTRNQMEFRKCSISGCVYGYGTTEVGLAAAKRRAGASASSTDDADKALPEYIRLERMQRAHVNFDPSFTFDDRRLVERLQGGHESSSKIREFLVALATCQTVVPEKSASTGKIVYQSESPDEGALVFAAQCFGFFFKVRKASFITVEEFDVGDQEYEVLNVNKFNSKRKRMSIVLRRPNGSIVLYCKGADSVMMQRIQNSSNDDQVRRPLRSRSRSAAVICDSCGRCNGTWTLLRVKACVRCC
jgi:phospholipid-transporting ATPase